MISELYICNTTSNHVLASAYNSSSRCNSFLADTINESENWRVHTHTQSSLFALASLGEELSWEWFFFRRQPIIYTQQEYNKVVLALDIGMYWDKWLTTV
jgi:hypothetical protein